jgi:PadR family transcriptional regulator
MLTLYPSAATLGRMTPTEDGVARDALLQGTLDLLILRVLLLGSHHGQGIARAIQARSGDMLLIDHGSLYPALQRLETRKLVVANWGVSENNRRARFYTLTKQGRARLFEEKSRWERIAGAIGRVLGPDFVPQA